MKNKKKPKRSFTYAADLRLKATLDATKNNERKLTIELISPDNHKLVAVEHLTRGEDTISEKHAIDIFKIFGENLGDYVVRFLGYTDGYIEWPYKKEENGK